jgi:hypothetical protein
MMKKSFLVGAVLLLAALAVFAQNVTATKYYVAHQGGYIGEATVTIDQNQKVVSASFADWQGPNGWAEYNSPDKKSLVDGAVVRVPDPLANPANEDPQIRGYMFYVYNLKDDGTYIWSQYTPTPRGFVKPARMYERDFEGLMSNPVRAEAYAKAARADTLANVTIQDLKVIVGKKASETVHYGHMNKADPRSTYMPLGPETIGFRYNYKATIDFFKANPAANYAAASSRPAKITLKEDRNVDASASAAAYTAASDGVWVVADAVTGATNSDFPHYALELQMAYKMAIAEQRVRFSK